VKDPLYLSFRAGFSLLGIRFSDFFSNSFAPQGFFHLIKAFLRVGTAHPSASLGMTIKMRDDKCGMTIKKLGIKSEKTYELRAGSSSVASCSSCPATGATA
jgi:hypothetical protein